MHVLSQDKTLLVPFDTSVVSIEAYRERDGQLFQPDADNANVCVIEMKVNTSTCVVGRYSSNAEAQDVLEQMISSYRTCMNTYVESNQDAAYWSEVKSMSFVFAMPLRI